MIVCGASLVSSLPEGQMLMTIDRCGSADIFILVSSKISSHPRVIVSILQ